MGIESKIRPVASLPKVLSILIYGRSGTGKTTIGSTFPKPLLFVDIQEKGTDSISNVEGVDVITVSTWAELEEVYWYLGTGAGKEKYKSVVLDQVSSMQDFAMAHAMEEEGKDQMSQRLWGITGGLMKTWLLNYRDLTDSGINVGFIAHDRATKGEGSDEDETLDPSIGPRLMPSVAGLLNGAVKVIGNTYVREAFAMDDEKTRTIEYCMRLAPHPYYTTKMRNPMGTSIPEYIVDPSYDKLMQLLASGETKPVRRIVEEVKPAAETKVVKRTTTKSEEK